MDKWFFLNIGLIQLTGAMIVLGRYVEEPYWIDLMIIGVMLFGAMAGIARFAAENLVDQLRKEGTLK